MRIAYFDCFSGIAGDMTLGAFIDAGLKLSTLSRELKKLGLRGYELEARRVKRCGIAGTKFDVVAKRGAPHSHRPLAEILKLIEKSRLKPKVKDTARAIFLNIGKAEAGVHGAGRISRLCLHELGGMDSIIDIVGAAIALDELGIDEVRSSCVNQGRTFVRSAHGQLPIPGPAALELLKNIPTKITDIEAELATPTGAAILKTVAKSFGPMPEMRISAIGYGAGSKELDGMPNMLRVIIGETKASFSEDAIFVIETNIDDMNPQHFEYVFERLFKEGALDAYLTQVLMKKSRPGFLLTCLAAHKDLRRMAAVIMKETTSIGVRFYEASRLKLERKIIKVKTRYGPVNAKVSKGPENISTLSPEYEDCAKIARAKEVPIKAVYDEAKSNAKTKLIKNF